MATKTWRLTVSGLGATGSPLHDVTVQAENWMTALRVGRTQIGEQGGVPTGASCAVAPDGKVTILDPAAQRAYVVTVVKSDSLRPPPAQGEAAPSVEVANLPPDDAITQDDPPPAPASIAANAPLDPKMAKRTMAFELPNMAQAQHAPVAVGTPASASAPTSVAPKAAPVGVNEKIAMATAAYVTPAKGSLPPPSVAPVAAHPAPAAAGQPAAASAPEPASAAEPAPSAAARIPGPAPIPDVAIPHAAASQRANAHSASQGSSSIEVSPEAYVPSLPPAATVGLGPVPVGLAPEPGPPGLYGGVRAQLLSERFDDPTPENPLTYRERTLVVPENTPLDVCERIIRDEMVRAQAELAEVMPGKFINLALFDHPWSKRPLRRPVVTLQWKDWRGDPEIAFPPRTPPTMLPPGMSIPPPGARVRRTSAPPAEQDERLANAFEACQDLFFLKSAADGLEFIVRLLRETVPSEAITSALYDINTDEFRFVALDGPGAGERRGDAIPSTAGLFGAAAASIGIALVVDDVHNDSRFDPGIDGRLGVEPRNMLLYALVHERRLLGMLQLINRSGRDYFGRGDMNVVTYIGKQLTEFLHEKRIEEKQQDPSPKSGPRGKSR
ncbi:MAG: hypothetical protein IPK60_00915 [Sandaracinaceae bacterium]|nr:hypothetical protein [Sandaracinaceae bacterium]